MTIQQSAHRYILERIYKKLLEDKRSRTISFDNIKDAFRDYSIRDFNHIFEDLADSNYAFSKPSTNTYFLVEDDPKKYAEFLKVSDDRVQTLEKIYGREDPEAKGAVNKGSMKEQYT